MVCGVLYWLPLASFVFRESGIWRTGNARVFVFAPGRSLDSVSVDGHYLGSLEAGGADGWTTAGSHSVSAIVDRVPRSKRVQFKSGDNYVHFP
jgi:hypothetical protein